MRKTLYERQKGKQMQMSGTWEATKKEQKLVNIVAILFAVSVVATLLFSFIPVPKIFLLIAIICTAITFVSVFVVMFGIVYIKNKKQPMEKHYYDVDYTYNGISDEVKDNTKEITKEEFKFRQ